MPSNANQQFMQQMHRNQQHSQRVYHQEAQRQQEQFKRTTDRWHRETAQRVQRQQQPPMRWRQFPAPRRRDLGSSSGPPARTWDGSPACSHCGTPGQPGDETCPCRGVTPARTVGRTLWPVLLTALVLLSTIVLIHAAFSQSGQSPHDPSVQPGRHGTIGWIREPSNVRAGPGTSHRIVGYLAAGKQVIIDCRAGSSSNPWDKLISPYPGEYVAASLIMSARLPQCSNT
jgi:hypothetical protein